MSVTLPAGPLPAPHVIRVLLREHLANRARELATSRRDILRQYLPVMRERAAYWFRRCQGAVDLDELQSAAYAAATAAAQRLVPGFSPAPFLRQAAHFACLHLVRENLADRTVRPDEEEWERIGGAAPEAAPLDLTAPQRRLARLLLRGDDDAAASRLGLTLEGLDEARRGLAAELGYDAAEGLLEPAEAAARAGLPIKTLRRAMVKGRVPVVRREGEAWVRLSDAREEKRRVG